MTQAACAQDWELGAVEHLSANEVITQWTIWFAEAARRICDHFGVPVDHCMDRIAELQEALVVHIRRHKCFASERRGGDVGLDAVRKDVSITLERPSQQPQLVMNVAFRHVDDSAKASALPPVHFDLPADSRCPVGVVITMSPPKM